METKFEDSNLALLGSDFEKNLKKAAAELEPEWKTAGLTEGVQVWRIEKFQVKPWPLEEYGNFFSGDTYIVLSTRKKGNSEGLEYFAHMWVGRETTQDEAGTGAYKIVELDDHFDRKAAWIYEPQDYESEMFHSYFKVINVMKGGIESGFKKVSVDQYNPRLFHVSGVGKFIHSTEVPIHYSSFNSEDVFILDLGLQIFNWTGKSASAYEKFHGASWCEILKADRNGKAKIISIDQGDKNEDFEKYFKDSNGQSIHEKREIDNDKKIGSHKKMIRLSDESGKLSLTEVKYEEGSLNTNDAFLIDRGDIIFIWIGKAASKSEKRFSLVFGQKYLVDSKRPPHVPIITIQEGQLQSEIDLCFKM